MNIREEFLDLIRAIKGRAMKSHSDKAETYFDDKIKSIRDIIFKEIRRDPFKDCYGFTLEQLFKTYTLRLGEGGGCEILTKANLLIKYIEIRFETIGEFNTWMYETFSMVSPKHSEERDSIDLEYLKKEKYLIYV